MLLPPRVRCPPNGEPVLVTSEFWLGATARALSEGFRLAGQSVTEVDVDDYFIAGRSVSTKLARRLFGAISVAEYNRRLVQAAKDAAAGMFVAVKGDRILPDTMRAVAAVGLTTVIYYPDYHFSYRGLQLGVIEEATLVCTTKRFQLPYLDTLRGHGRSVLLQHGYTPAIHRPFFDDVTEGQYLFDISFVGTASEAKLRWLIAVAEAFCGQRIMVAGNGWLNATKGTPVEKFVHDGPVHNDWLARLHQLSKVNIAVHHGPASAEGWQDDVSTRTFEIPACRAFMLHIDNPEVRGLFDVPSEIDVFSSPDELCGKIAYYLDRPEARAEMAARAFQRAVPAYSYHQRATEILAAVGELRSRDGRG
jgi:hypothetical protein